jgi:malonate-semialdehyde dehydrogenase (acetylating)/methylmalonate-semialdehyde dehydrogenase
LVTASGDSGDVFNPSTGDVIARVPFCTAEETAEVTAAAAAALSTWSGTPVIERARLMFRYRELLETHFEELSRLVTREHGKTLAESRAEVRRGIEVVEFACGIPSLIMGQSLPDVARDVDAEVTRHPVGVCAGITPYNFPAMVPLWMFPIAITCGNTFVLKPSEKVPLSAVRLGELLQEAGCPDGVFNIVHGDRTCVEALLADDRVAAVSFVGSSPVARWIYETGTRAGKRVQAAGGAKNHFIILPDADPALAVEALAASAFGCGGQRCMATSIAVAVGSRADRLVEQLCDHASKLRVGPTDGCENVDVGPLIRREHVERVAGYLTAAEDEGAEVALDGRREFNSRGFFLAPSVVDRVAPEMRVAREEIFGPVLSVIRAPDLDAALALGQDGRFGNGASLFTRDGYAARQFRQRFNAGMIGINVGVPAPTAWFPFTGWNGSFFGDLHVQGLEGMQFYTRQKVTLSRWFAHGGGDAQDPVWKSDRPGKP